MQCRHEHYVVEKIDCPLYVKKILTPVISSGLEHVMTTIPYKNPLKDRTYISASIMADILYRKFVLALPFFRQAVDYYMQGLDLSRQVMIGWVNELVPLIMTPVIKYMIQLMQFLFLIKTATEYQEVTVLKHSEIIQTLTATVKKTDTKTGLKL